jgi:ribose-phosphate pyrophosphokinase
MNQNNCLTTESILFSLDGRLDLADAILSRANSWAVDNKTVLGKLRKQKFSDGELCIDFTDSVRGKRVYILTSAITSDMIMELNFAIDAAKRGAAKEIIPILPYFPYARQDKKDQSRGPIGAKVMAEMIEQRGATSVITFDLHADQIQGFFNIPVTHIEGKNVFAKSIATYVANFKDSILCGPDAGSGKRVKRMKEQLAKDFDISLPIVMIDKTRKEANEISEMVVIGDVKDKNVIIVDDMVDTAGTLCEAAQMLLDEGAKQVVAVISHGVLSGPAYDRIFNSNLTLLVVSDSLPIKESFYKTISGDTKQLIDTDSKIMKAPIAQQFGMAIAAINNNMSYEALKQNEKNHTNEV